MSEAERRPPRTVADDQLLALELVDVPVDKWQRGVGEEGVEGVAARIDPDDRRAAKQVAFTGAQAVEPHSEQALERGGDVAGRDLPDRREQLLGEQRVPAGRVDDSLQCLGRNRADPIDDQVLDLAGR